MVDIRRIVKEEVVRLVKEAKAAEPEIGKKLESLRKKLEPEMVKNELNKEDRNRKAKKLELKTVSEIIDVDISQLVVYFINHVKTKNINSLVEYHAGLVFFFADED